MTIKWVSILCGIFIAICFLSAIFFTYASPFKQEKLDALVLENSIQKNDWESLSNILKEKIDNGTITEYLNVNAIIGLLLVAVNTGFLFCALHLSIDKLFFKKFYEEPSKYQAIRRSVEASLVTGVILYLKIYGLDNLSLLSIIFSVVLTEVIFSKYLYSELVRRAKLVKNLKNSTKPQDVKEESQESVGF